MKAKLTWIAALVLALGLIAAGCGDDDGNDTESEATDTVAAATLSKAEFLEQGNEICKQGDKELDQASSELGESSSKEEVDAFVTDTVVPTIQGQIDDIRALGIPEGDETQVNGILEDAEASLAEIEADPDAIRQGDPFAQVNKDLDAYGLTECAG